MKSSSLELLKNLFGSEPAKITAHGAKAAGGRGAPPSRAPPVKRPSVAIKASPFGK